MTPQAQLLDAIVQVQHGQAEEADLVVTAQRVALVHIDPEMLFQGSHAPDPESVLVSRLDAIKADVPEADGQVFSRYDTSVAGNANTGHVYGTTLSDDDKRAVVEYLKTF